MTKELNKQIKYLPIWVFSILHCIGAGMLIFGWFVNKDYFALIMYSYASFTGLIFLMLMVKNKTRGLQND